MRQKYFAAIKFSESLLCLEFTEDQNTARIENDRLADMSIFAAYISR